MPLISIRNGRFLLYAWILLPFALGLSSCKPSIDKERDRSSRLVFDELRVRNYSAILNGVPTGDRTPQYMAMLAGAAAKIPATPPLSFKALSWQFQLDGEGDDIRVRRRYVYPSESLVVTTIMYKVGGMPMRLRSVAIAEGK